jgi:hypothetical protein
VPERVQQGWAGRSRRDDCLRRRGGAAGRHYRRGPRRRCRGPTR